MKTFRILYSCALFLSLSSSISLAEEKNYGLQEVIDIAIEKNPTAAIFKANIEASQGEVVSSKAYPNPEVGFEAGRGRSLEGSNSGGEYSVSVGQPLEWPKKRAFRRRAAKAALEATVHDTGAFNLELLFEVKQAFYQFILNKKEEEIAGKNLETVNELLRISDLRVRAGETPEFELVKARVETLKAEKELARAKIRVAIARAGLNSLLGNALPEGFDVEGEFPSPEKRYDRGEVLSAALERHPVILRQSKEVEAKGYALEMERQSVIPDVTVKGFYGREIDKESYAVGFFAPIPFWYQKKGEIATASAEKAKAEAELSKVRIELSLAVEQAFKNYRIALDQIDVFDKGLLKQAEEALRIAELSYRQGESGILDYLDAQRIHRQTLLEYNQARYELSVYLAEIERVMGKIDNQEKGS